MSTVNLLHILTKNCLTSTHIHTTPFVGAYKLFSEMKNFEILASGAGLARREWEREIE
jgi:hypothetical protein